MTLYHVWFSTKGRKEVLDGDVGDEVKRHFGETARRTGIRLVELEAIADHVHLVVDVVENQTLSSVMHQLKGASARHIFKTYPELKLDTGHTSFWQKGYGWRRVAPSEAGAVRKYVRAQRHMPLRRNA